ncbi:MAG: NAD(+) diphosphatase [Rhodospirillum sp.]|nr:NAD(+) diphosphatase [Rhodospirillum sp.]MCF8490458.1 NAD(+) diphosphatase [Rhodospirillum sp.]MCF8500845.1 NAD(+) diphosphatase [Rhodospirillum sp.]
MSASGSSALVYTQARHDRVTTGCLDQEALEALGRGPLARWFLLWRGRPAITEEGDILEVNAEVMERLAGLGPRPDTGHPSFHLGLDGESPLHLLDLSALPGRPDAEGGGDPGPDLELPGSPIFRDLRGFAYTQVPSRVAALAQGMALAAWHGAHPFCARCGSRTRLDKGGRMRVCLSPDCGVQHFPRVDPVVIMLIEDPNGERCLLGRQARFAPGMYSALAGFAEPGETLEAAVAREAKEEAGVDIVSCRYIASQPWPWPTNLMVGFIARTGGTELTIDREELEDARWFTRAEVTAMGNLAEGGEGVKLPGKDAIARYLLLGWLDGSL